MGFNSGFKGLIFMGMKFPFKTFQFLTCKLSLNVIPQYPSRVLNCKNTPTEFQIVKTSTRYGNCQNSSLINKYSSNKLNIIGNSSIPQYSFFKTQHPPVGHGLLIVEVFLSHWDTPHSVGLLCASDQPDAGKST